MTIDASGNKHGRDGRFAGNFGGVQEGTLKSDSLGSRASDWVSCQEETDEHGITITTLQRGNIRIHVRADVLGMVELRTIFDPEGEPLAYRQARVGEEPRDVLSFLLASLDVEELGNEADQNHPIQTDDGWICSVCGMEINDYPRDGVAARHTPRI